MLIDLKASELYDETYRSEKKITVHRGGSSSSKTWSILQYLVTYALEHPNSVISIVRQSLPALKKSAIRDLQTVINDAGLDKRVRYWRTDSTFEFFDTGSIIECFGLDDAQKARGPRRHVLYVDEANEITYEMFKQLNLRTRRRTILSFNPSDPEIWINKEIEQTRMKHKKDVDVVISNYLANPFLMDEEVAEIEYMKPMYNDRGELIKGDEQFWRIYGMGEYGNFSGSIFKAWQPINQMPMDIEVWYAGVDFGFVHDPTAIILVGRKNDELYVKELAYGRAMSTKTISQILMAAGNPIAFCDNDPRAIADLQAAGCHAVRAIKGPDSVLQGIQLLQNFQVYYMADSLNVANEVKKYCWEMGRDGEYINQPIDKYNHCMDAIRYPVYSKYRTRQSFRTSI